MGISEENTIQLTNKLSSSYDIASPLDVDPTPPLLEIIRFIHPVLICLCLNLTPVKLYLWNFVIYQPFIKNLSSSINLFVE